jgi:hypothetical protein
LLYRSSAWFNAEHKRAAGEYPEVGLEVVSDSNPLRDRCAPYVSHHSQLERMCHRDFQICMTQQFLNNFRILAVGVQDRAERMAKRMPTDTFG